METISSPYRSIGLARGVVLHAFEIDGPRTRTLCDRAIRINPRYLDDRPGSYALPAEGVTCKRCLKLAA